MKIAEMALNNYTNAEIATEMEVDLRSISTSINRARRRGLNIRKEIPANTLTKLDIEQMERLLSIKPRLLYREIAERAGVSPKSIPYWAQKLGKQKYKRKKGS